MIPVRSFPYDLSRGRNARLRRRSAALSSRSQASARRRGDQQQRESAKELEASRQTHERLLANGAHLFEKRSSVYEQMVGMLRRWLEEVAATEPSIFSLASASAARVTELDEQRAMNAKLRTFGSKEVADAYDEFMRSMLEFNALAVQVRTAIEVQAAQVPAERVILQDGARRPRDDRAARERRTGHSSAASRGGRRRFTPPA